MRGLKKKVQEISFLRWLFWGQTKIGQKGCQMGWIGSPILHVALKAIMGFQFLAYFWNLLSWHRKFCYIQKRQLSRYPEVESYWQQDKFCQKFAPLLAARNSNGFNFRKPIWKIIITGSVFCISTFFWSRLPDLRLMMDEIQLRSIWKVKLAFKIDWTSHKYNPPFKTNLRDIVSEYEMW